MTSEGPKSKDIDASLLAMPEEAAPSWPYRLLALSVGYCFISGGLTVYNKWLIADVGFDCPVLLIVLTYTINFVLAIILREMGDWRGWRLGDSDLKQVLPARRWTLMIPIGVCAGLEVASSNAALLTIDVAFHTMIKATTPIFVLFFSVALGLQAPKLSLILVVLLVSGGVIVLSGGESDGGMFSLAGFAFTIGSCALSGLRWALSQLLLQGKRGSHAHGRVNPLTLLFYMTPFGMLALLPLSLATEWGKADELLAAQTPKTIAFLLLAICVCALLAFGLLMVEFFIVQCASSLTLCMVGVVKELLLIATAVVFLGNTLPASSALGFFLTLSGILGYHIVSHWGIPENPTVMRERLPSVSGNGLPRNCNVGLSSVPPLQGRGGAGNGYVVRSGLHAAGVGNKSSELPLRADAELSSLGVGGNASARLSCAAAAVAIQDGVWSANASSESSLRQRARSGTSSVIEGLDSADDGAVGVLGEDIAEQGFVGLGSVRNGYERIPGDSAGTGAAAAAGMRASAASGGGEAALELLRDREFL